VCGIKYRVIPTYGVVENVKVWLARYPEIVLLMEIVVVDVPDVWGMLLSRNFSTTLGGALHMDLNCLDIPMDDGTYACLPNMALKNNHVEEIDIDSEMEEPPEVEESLLDFCPDDLPFATEEDFSVID
jgi:hypothetical protein